PPTGDTLAMIQRAPAAPLGTLLGTRRRTLAVCPGSQPKYVRRVRATMFCDAVSMWISTYCTPASPPAPDITSSMSVMWKSACRRGHRERRFVAPDVEQRDAAALRADRRVRRVETERDRGGVRPDRQPAALVPVGGIDHVRGGGVEDGRDDDVAVGRPGDAPD